MSNKIVNRFQIFIITLTVIALVNVSYGGVKESWYMMRGKANMKIKNYQAAIEAYEKALQINPNNREANKTLGEAYEYQGLTDKAVQQYGVYLEKFGDDAEMAFKLGDILQWSRYNYRKSEAKKYYRMGLRHKNDPIYRHKLAKLLASDKSTVHEAIAEYKILLKNDPKNNQYRSEYRKLLPWDDRYLEEAIVEYRALASQYPEDFSIQLEYARLLARGKGHNREAQKRYELLLKMQPNNTTVREEYARVLAKDPSRFNDAKREFERVLQTNDKASTREAYADLLATKASTRDDAKKEYKKILDDNPSNTRVRLKYANLLSEKKENAPEAIRQYETVVREQPSNAEAHRGLAKMYAWTGDKDKAVYHSQQAVKYAPRDKSTQALNEELEKGREPYVGPAFTFIHQPGDTGGYYTLSGFSLVGKLRVNPSYFTTLFIDGGFEDYWGDKFESVFGGIVRGELQIRPTSNQAFNIGLGYRTLVETGNGLELLLKYAFTEVNWGYAGGFRRELVDESILSLAGGNDSAMMSSTTRPKPMGSVKRNVFFGEAWGKYEFLEGRIQPFGGFMSAQSVDANPTFGVDAEVAAFHKFMNINTIALAYSFATKTFQDNYSGFSFPTADSMPGPGGYFSPSLFVAHGPKVKFTYDNETDQRFFISSGPSFTYVDPATEESAISLDLQASFFKKVVEKAGIQADLMYSRSGSTYSRLKLSFAGMWYF